MYFLSTILNPLRSKGEVANFQEGNSHRETQKNIVPMSLLALILGCGVLLIVASLLSRYFIARPGHDQSAYLFEAQRLLSGAELYGPHLSETNPPMIVWFSQLPVLFASCLHGSPIFFLWLLVVAMVFGSVAWSIRMLRRGAALTNPVAVGLLGCAILAIEFRIRPYDFGQREHLLIILLLPYTLATATGAVYRLSFAERCALGVAAGIAIWFKPQDVLVLIGLEIFLSLRVRSLRRALSPEFLALVLTSSLVLLLVRVITPLYGSRTVPLLFDTYWGFGTSSALALALSLRLYMMQVFLMLLACILFRSSLRDPVTTVALLVCSLAASFAFDIQHTDWTYHRYPHRALLLLALAYLLTDLLYPVILKFTSNLHLIRRMVLVASGLLAVLLCAIAIHPRFVLPDPRQHQSLEPDQFFAQYRPSTTVYAFSTSVYPLSTAFNHGLNWGSRFAHLWMLPAIIQNELGPTGPPAPFKRLSPETLARLAALQRSESAEDLNYWRPSVVLVELCSLKQPCQGIEGKNFNMISWFLQSPEFAAAWSHYQQQPGLDDYDVYKLVP
jgi:hypothetical protein